MTWLWWSIIGIGSFGLGAWSARKGGGKNTIRTMIAVAVSIANPCH